MADRNSNEPIFSGWQVACYVIAAAIVYFFDEQLYQAVCIIGATIVNGPGMMLARFADGFMRSGMPIFPGIFYALAMMVGALIMLVVALVVVPPVAAAYWLAMHPGLPRYILDVGLVWLLGTFLYGTIFPLLWTVLAPIVAATLGEITYQRLRHRVFGDRLRLGQPLYLIVALLCLAFAATRLLAPAVQTGQTAWHDMREGVFNPTPLPWPKTFTVGAGQMLRTGITVGEKNEVKMTTTAHLKFGLTPPEADPTVFRKTDSSGRDCYAGSPWYGVCRAVYFVFFHRGELTLFGGDDAATVQVWEPGSVGRYWFLRKGEVYTVRDWFDPGDHFTYCGGNGLSFRVVGVSKSSPWQELSAAFPYSASAQEVPRPGAGHLEVRADAVPTWFAYYSVRREYWQYTVNAERLVDTGIRVRRGDSFSVQVIQQEPLYLMRSSGPYLLHPGKSWLESADYDGTIRLKGGLTRSEASVHIETRGMGWK